MTDTKLPSFTPLVESLPSTIPFVGPKAIERRRNETFKVRVGANESAFGVSPKAAAAMRDAVENIAWYGDPEGYDLRTAIAAHHGVEMDEVCLGGGIDELLGLTVRMLAQPGARVDVFGGLSHFQLSRGWVWRRVDKGAIQERPH